MSINNGFGSVKYSPEYSRLRPIFSLLREPLLSPPQEAYGLHLPDGTVIRHRCIFSPMMKLLNPLPQSHVQANEVIPYDGEVTCWGDKDDTRGIILVDFASRVAGRSIAGLQEMQAGEDDVAPSIANGDFWHRVRVAGLPDWVNLYLTIPNEEDREFEELTRAMVEALSPFKMFLIDYAHKEVWRGSCDYVREARNATKALLPELKIGLSLWEIIMNFWLLDA